MPTPSAEATVSVVCKGQSATPVSAGDVEAETIRSDLASGCDESPCAPFALTLLAALCPAHTDDLNGVKPRCLERVDANLVPRTGDHLHNLTASARIRSRLRE